MWADNGLAYTAPPPPATPHTSGNLFKDLIKVMHIDYSINAHSEHCQIYMYYY
jgi:hypothetical protein